jgi:hypothetical protein
VFAAEELAWGEKMRKLSTLLQEILIDASSESRARSGEGKRRLQKNTEQLSKLSHSMAERTLSPDLDPSMKLLGDLFAEEADRARDALKSGNIAYSRYLLKGVAQGCIACHTRTQSGPAFSAAPKSALFARLPAIERAEIQVAIREFAPALETLRGILKDQTLLKEKPGDWASAARLGLMVAVRTQQDPKVAQEWVNLILAEPHAPYFLSHDAKAWKVAIEKWIAEPKREAVTAEGLYAEAVRLFTQAKNSQRYFFDHSADVDYLRASAAAHNLMRLGSEVPHLDQALLMAGMTYEALGLNRFPELHETYYQACIRRAPHTALAEDCYRRLEQSIYQGYTGSAGTDIPLDLRRRLKKWETEAREKTGKSTPRN